MTIKLTRAMLAPLSMPPADPLRWRDPEQPAARPLLTTHALLVLQRRAEG